MSLVGAEKATRSADTDRLIGIVRRLAGRRVAVLGDLIVDEFVHGDIARVSREAPVLILEHRQTILAPGGAGNAAANLRALGARPLLFGAVGRDATGRALTDQLRTLGIPTSGIHRVAGWETPCKSRIVAGGVHTRRQQVLRVDRGATRGSLPEAAADRVARSLTDSVDRVDGLLVADYGYGIAEPRRVHRATAAMTFPRFVDSRGRVGEYRGVTACTPNQEEVEHALGLEPLKDGASVSAAGRKLLRQTAASAVLITRGAQGMCLCRPKRPPLVIPAHGSDEVADVTGAGDTVIAAFALAVIAGAEFEDAARLANCAAGLVVMKAGTATVSAEELEQALRESGP